MTTSPNSPATSFFPRSSPGSSWSRWRARVTTARLIRFVRARVKAAIPVDAGAVLGARRDVADHRLDVIAGFDRLCLLLRAKRARVALPVALPTLVVHQLRLRTAQVDVHDVELLERRLPS